MGTGSRVICLKTTKSENKKAGRKTWPFFEKRRMLEERESRKVSEKRSLSSGLDGKIKTEKPKIRGEGSQTFVGGGVRGVISW